MPSYNFNGDAPAHDTLAYGDILASLVWWRGGQSHNFGFRCQPVPGIHHPRGGHYFRHPRTTRELRDLALSNTREARQDWETYGPPVRNRHVRNAWDDFPRGRAGRRDHNKPKG